MIKHSWIIILVLAFAACEKQEWQGGKGEITGTITEELQAPDGSISETRPAAVVDVFITGVNIDYKDDTKINSFGKIVQFITEELTPNIFQEDTEKVYKLNKKIIDGLIYRV